ncbi:hypothetical protein [Trichothermofontia sp.]
MSANLPRLDRTDLYQAYFAQEAGFDADHLAFLDRGISNSPFQADITTYADRLAAPILSPGGGATLPTDLWQPYPNYGQLPTIQEGPLDFLHPDIQQACLCIGTWDQQTLQTQWWGRQALMPVEFWSATKIIPLLYFVVQVNSLTQETNATDSSAKDVNKNINIDRYLIRDRRSDQSYRFSELATEVINYQEQIATSNAIAHSFKLFATPIALETWLKQLTGNSCLTFQGRYGEPPFLKAPELYDPTCDRVILTAQVEEHPGDNTVSAYDLTRVLSTMAWHLALPASTRIPGVTWQNLRPLITALGTDSARYLDVAISTLKLEPYLQAPVILSKMGFGRSGIRDRTELSYVVLGQWQDTRYQPARSQAFCLTLLAAQANNDPDEEARILDARIATEVTEILYHLTSTA